MRANAVSRTNREDELDLLKERKLNSWMALLYIDHLTKDYGHNRGVFDVSLKVEKGEFMVFSVQMERVKLQLFDILWDFRGLKKENFCKWNG